jgi:hypothetical protein
MNASEGVRMADGERTILDHIDGIEVPGLVFKEPANEYWQLSRLWHGMAFLYEQVARLDAVILERVNEETRKRFGKGRSCHKIALFGNHSALADLPIALIECSFDWYAITACQFVRLIGEIGHRQNPTQHARGKEYAQKVIPAVCAYRDKVAAHFAWVTQNDRDNAAERLVSVIPQLSFVDDTLMVSVLTMYRRSGAKTSDSENIKPWSLRKTHEALIQRYLPQASEEAADGQQDDCEVGLAELG